MPITKIDTVHMSLLGLCFLKDDQRDILKKEWDDRIDADTALWVELDPSSSYEQVKNTVLEAIQKKHGVIAKNQCVMAAFLDFQQQIPPELPKILKKLQETMDLVLNRTTNAILQFGYIGIRGLSNGRAARENAALFAQENAQRPAAIQHRICLVASEYTRVGDENNWRAATVLLDLLRRQHSIVGFLPTSPNGLANDDVGYLRYAEYNKVSHATLLKERERIRKLQGPYGDKALFDLYSEKRSALRAKIRERFTVTANIHPVHPGMTVTGYFKIRKAQSGKLDTYNTAASLTRDALNRTAEQMEQDIRAFFSQQILSAREELLDMFRSAEVGLELKSSKAQMYAILNVTAPSIRPRLPELNYKPEGPSEEIYSYLTHMRTYITDCCIAEYEEQIRAAYDALVQAGFVEEEQRLSKELSQTDTRLAELHTPKAILSMVQSDDFLPETGLTPKNVDGRQRGYVTYRGDEETRNEIAADAGSVTAYEMKPFADDPESKKRWPVKAVQMVVCDNSEQVLNGLINWDNEA